MAAHAARATATAAAPSSRSAITLELPTRRLFKNHKYVLSLTMPLDCDLPVTQLFTAGVHPLIRLAGTATNNSPIQLSCSKCGVPVQILTSSHTSDVVKGTRTINFILKPLCSSSKKHLGGQIVIGVKLSDTLGTVWTKPLRLLSKEIKKEEENDASGSASDHGSSSASSGFAAFLQSPPTTTDTAQLPTISLDAFRQNKPQQQGIASPQPNSTPAPRSYTVIRTFLVTATAKSKVATPELFRSIAMELAMYFNREVPGIVEHTIHVPVTDGMFVQTASFANIAFAQVGNVAFHSWVANQNGREENGSISILGTYNSWD